jgi:hypothetical protein
MCAVAATQRNPHRERGSFFAMDPFHLCLGLGPVSVYLLLIGRINLGRRPFLTTGTRDALALAIALCGLAVVGPLRLFMPSGALLQLMGPWIWLPLIALYGLCCLLAVLLMRPRLVVYNATVSQLRPVLDQVAGQLDAGRHWAGSTLVLPDLGVQCVLEDSPAMQNVQLVAIGSAVQDLQGWRRLELSLRAALRSLPVEPNRRGLSLLLFGVLLAAVILYSLGEQPREVARGLEEFLQP